MRRVGSLITCIALPLPLHLAQTLLQSMHPKIYANTLSITITTHRSLVPLFLCRNDVQKPCTTPKSI